MWFFRGLWGKGKMTHKTVNFREYAKRLFREIMGITNETLLVLRSHLFIEYLINEIIRLYFKNYGKIFDMEAEIGFRNKVRIIEATGLFDKFEYGSDLLHNIIKINEIRNKYAHTFNIVEIETSIKSKIETMELSKKSYDGKKEIPKKVIDSVSKHHFTKFRFLVIESATHLTSMLEKLQNQQDMTGKD